MTRTAVKRALARNRRAGRQPSSQYQLAAMMGVTRSFVSHVLSGRRTSRPFLQRCGQIFDGAPVPR